MIKRGRIRFNGIKTWWMVVILVPLFFIDVTLLRQGHVKMTELRDAVLSADVEGDEETIRARLEELRDFTQNNIVINIVDDNGAQRITFGTGPFYLENQYLRDANAALEQAEALLAGDNNPNGNIYQMASDVCRPQAIANGWAWNNPNYINCMTSEIQKYPAADNIQDSIVAALPSTELYRYNFASPVWAPTATGWVLLLTVAMVVVILIRIIWWLILRLSLFFM